MPHLPNWLATTLVVLLPGTLMAAPLPVKIDRFEGEVVQVSGTIHSGVSPGKNLQEGTQVQTGPDGRAELSLNGATTLSIGGGADLLVHSVQSGVLRLRIASGALHVDTRAAGTKPARDVRLNVGDLRLRIQEADVWTELGDRGGQVCLVAGVVEAQQPNTTLRLDTPGQCLRQSGLTSQWSMVPVSVLDDRVALVSVRESVTAAPKPEARIKALTLPVEPEPSPTIVTSEPAPAVSVPPAASRAPEARPVIVLEKPVPVGAASPSSVDAPVPQVAKVDAPAIPPVRARPVPIEPEPISKPEAAAAPVAVIPGPTEPADLPHGSAPVTTAKPAPVAIIEKAAVPASEKTPAKPAAKTAESAATFPHVPPVIVLDKPLEVAATEKSKSAPAPIELPPPVAKPVVAAPPPPAQVAVAAKPPAPPVAYPVVKGEPVPLYPHVPPVIVIESPAASDAASDNSSAPATAQALPAPALPPVLEKLPEAPAPAGTVAMAFPAPVEAPALPEQSAVKPRPAKPVAIGSIPPAPKADAKAITTPAAPASEAKSTKSAAQLDNELAIAEPASSGPDDGRRWRVVLGSMPEPEKADIEAERLNARGWAVEAREYRVGDRHGYRIGFGEFAERDQAQKALEEFLVQYPEAPAWLAKY